MQFIDWIHIMIEMGKLLNGSMIDMVLIDTESMGNAKLHIDEGKKPRFKMPKIF